MMILMCVTEQKVKKVKCQKMIPKKKLKDKEQEGIIVIEEGVVSGN